MEKLKINFADFWGGFDKRDNYFYHLLSNRYSVEISDTPDVLFFSVDYSGKNEYSRFRGIGCKRVFFTGESVSPNFVDKKPQIVNNFSAKYRINKCDFAFSFDRNSLDNHFRLPLWVTYIDWFGLKKYGNNPSFLTPLSFLENGSQMGSNDIKFCASIFSNATKERLQLVNKISNYKKVDTYGSPFGNFKNGEFFKYEVLKDYKFSICVENRIKRGYYTEKLFHAKTAGTVPIYMWDKTDDIDFNPDCFVNIGNFNDLNELVDYLIFLDENKEEFNKIKHSGLFQSSEDLDKFSPNSVLNFIEKVVLK